MAQNINKTKEKTKNKRKKGKKTIKQNKLSINNKEFF